MIKLFIAQNKRKIQRINNYVNMSAIFQKDFIEVTYTLDYPYHGATSDKLNISTKLTCADGMIDTALLFINKGGQSVIHQFNLTDSYQNYPQYEVSIDDISPASDSKYNYIAGQSQTIIKPTLTPIKIKATVNKLNNKIEYNADKEVGSNLHITSRIRFMYSDDSKQYIDINTDMLAGTTYCYGNYIIPDAPSGVVLPDFRVTIMSSEVSPTSDNMYTYSIQ